MLTILNGKELFKNHPKSRKALGVWFLKQAQITETLIPSDIDMDGLLLTFIQYQPRQLYDFFDEQGVQIGISPLGGDFVYFNSRENESFTADDRQTAEKLAINDAFKILEKLL